MIGIYLALIDNDEDKKLFETIYKNNFDLMYHIANQILHQPSDIENAIHDAFVSLGDHFDKYKTLTPQKMTGLCVVIVKNKSLNIIRDQKHFSDKELDTVFLPDTSVQNDPQYQAELSDSEYKALSILKSIPEIYQEVMFLRYYYNYSRKDISKLLNIPIRTVDKRIYIAKEKIRGIINETANDR